MLVKSPIPANIKSNGGPQMLARHQNSIFHLICIGSEWTESFCFGKLRFWKIVLPISFQIPARTFCFEKSRPGNNSHIPYRVNQLLLRCFAIHEQQDLKKLVRKLSISAQLLETFDLLCPKPFQKLLCFFPPNPKEGNPRFPDAGGDRQTPRSKPLPTRPGMKYVCKVNPCC